MIKGKFEKVKIDRLKKAPWNYKEDDPELIKKLANNIRRNGVVVNLIVREIGSKKPASLEVIDGNHRLEAVKIIAEELGLQEIMVCNCGKLSLEEAQRMAVEINETRFVNDQLNLAKTIKSITGAYTLEELLTTLPYNQETLEGLIKLADFDFDALPDREKPKGKGGIIIRLNGEEGNLFLTVKAEIIHEKGQVLTDGECVVALINAYKTHKG